MAFSPYFYPGYQPQYYPQPLPDAARTGQNQFQQPAMPQIPAVQPAAPANPSQNSGMIWVSGKADADGYMVAPGSAVALWDANNPVVYLRQADSTGKPSTTVYELVERNDSRPAASQANMPLDLSNYVTREQLEEILSERLKKPVRGSQKKEDTDNA